MAESEDVVYGFIGIGQMGYGMAQNLRTKAAKQSRLIICELVQSRRNQFLEETTGRLETAESPRAVAEKSVSSYEPLGDELARRANQARKLSWVQASGLGD